MSKPVSLSDFERTILVMLIKQASESGNDACETVEEAFKAYQLLSELIEAVPLEKRLS